MKIKDWVGRLQILKYLLYPILTGFCWKVFKKIKEKSALTISTHNPQKCKKQ
jgi:hypothetical protein